MDFEAVDPQMIRNRSAGHRGRVSYPLLKSYMESNLPVAKLKMDGIQQSLVALRSSLTAYIKSHDLPVYVFQRDGDLYLARYDMEVDEEGTVHLIEDWKKNSPYASRGTNRGALADTPATPVNMDEVNKRYEEEKGNVTS
jgi:hypothetical protein